MMPSQRRPIAPGIVAILPRGEAIRNFVQANTLDRVAADADLTVLSVVPNVELFESLRARFPRVEPLDEIAERYPVRILRELLDMAHGRYLWSAAAQERWRLRNEEATTMGQRAKRLGKKVACYPFASRRGLRALERAERVASRAFRNTDRYARLFADVRPALVFNGSHVHSRNAIQAVQAARWQGIPTAAFIFSWDNLTSQGRVIPAYDYYLVWNAEIKAQLLEIYPEVHRDHVFVTGTPQFDCHFRPEAWWTREEFCQRIGADPARPIVLYSTGMADHMRGEPAVVEQVADMLAEMTDVGRPQLLVRVYPKDRSGRFDALRQHRKDILFPEAKWVDAWSTPTVADNRLLTNTLRHVAAGANIASTISLELCMFDKPVVNVGYDPPGVSDVRVPYARYYEYDHYAPLVASGAVQLAHSPAEMAHMLRSALTEPAVHQGARQRFIERMFGGTLDGRSSDRVAQVLLHLAAQDR